MGLFGNLFSDRDPLQQLKPRGPWVKERDIIAMLLRIAIEEQETANIYAGEEAKPFSTLMLKIDPENSRIYLDAIADKIGHAIAQQNKDWIVRGRIDGVEYSFKTRFLQIRTARGMPVYECSYPEKLRYQERRAQHRVSLHNKHVRFRAPLPTDEGRKLVQGFGVDLCNDGVGIILNDPAQLSRNDVVTAGILTLPGGKEVLIPFQVRYVRDGGADGYARIGGSFKDLDRSVVRQLHNTINAIERDRRKKKAS